MGNSDWIKRFEKMGSGGGGEDDDETRGRENEPIGDDPDGHKENSPEDSVKEEPAEITPEEMETIREPMGERFDPFITIAVLGLIDIAPEVRRIKKVPRFYHIRHPETIIGTGKRASIKADDFQTVKEEHGAIVFINGSFYICPLEGEVHVNGRKVERGGIVLEHGAHLQMGSAGFVFLSTNLV